VIEKVQRKIIITTITVMLFAALAGGATMALFTDVATNANNSFRAGTVDIAADRDLGDPIPGPMFYTTIAEGQPPGQPPPFHPTGLWWPGRTVVRNLDVRNLGSLQVRINRVSAQIVSINGVAPPSALATSFANNMNVEIFVAGHPGKVLYEGSLAKLLAPQTTVHKPVIAPLVVGGWPPMVQLAYEVTMSSTAGNDLQGIVPIVSFSVYAEQTANN